MSSTTKMHIPHTITEFDEAMLVPLDRNFSEIQRHVVSNQFRLDTLETQMAAVIAALST